MKIVDRNVTLPATTLNDIPVGTTFRGSVWGKNSKRWTRGIFFKAHGNFASDDKSFDCVVVRLDGGHVEGFANLWPFCTDVRDYEPLAVELVIK